MKVQVHNCIRAFVFNAQYESWLKWLGDGK